MITNKVVITSDEAESLIKLFNDELNEENELTRDWLTTYCLEQGCKIFEFTELDNELKTMRSWDINYRNDTVSEYDKVILTQWHLKLRKAQLLNDKISVRLGYCHNSKIGKFYDTVLANVDNVSCRYGYNYYPTSKQCISIIEECNKVIDNDYLAPYQVFILRKNIYKISKYLERLELRERKIVELFEKIKA